MSGNNDKAGISGERRLPACSCRQLAGNNVCNHHAFDEMLLLNGFRQVAENNRLAACAPRKFRVHHSSFVIPSTFVICHSSF
jgi:hypothetical protein